MILCKYHQEDNVFFNNKLDNFLLYKVNFIIKELKFNNFVTGGYR